MVLETMVSLPFKHLTWLVGQQIVIPKFHMSPTYPTIILLL